MAKASEKKRLQCKFSRSHCSGWPVALKVCIFWLSSKCGVEPADSKTWRAAEADVCVAGRVSLEITEGSGGEVLETR